MPHSVAIRTNSGILRGAQWREDRRAGRIASRDRSGARVRCRRCQNRGVGAVYRIGYQQLEHELSNHTCFRDR